MTNAKTEKKEPKVENKIEPAQLPVDDVQTQLISLGNAINNHAAKINESRASTNILLVDNRAIKATQEIFNKRFGLVERQLDNIEKELSRIVAQLDRK